MEKSHVCHNNGPGYFNEGNFVRALSFITAVFFCSYANAADNAIEYPAVDNNVGFGQVQSLDFRQANEILAYGEDQFQFGELFLPANASPPHPLIVFIHGGCWQNSFDMSHTYPFLSGLAQEGFAVWSLEYRRTGDPGGGWPGTYEDIKNGVNHLSSLSEYRVDTDNFLIAGHSAGGHLALLAGTDTPSAKGVIAIAPITNIIAYSQGSNSCQAGTSQFMGSSYNQNPLTYRQANPAEKTPHANTVILHGSLDEIVPIEQSRLTGARTVLEEGASHFDWIHPGSNGFQIFVRTAKGLLD